MGIAHAGHPIAPQAPPPLTLLVTPNLSNPVMLLNRIGKALPALQRRMVAKLYGRVVGDTFPVQYQANTASAIRTLASTVGLHVAELRAVPDPTYLALNGFMFRASVLSERLMPKGWGVHLLGDLEKR